MPSSNSTLTVSVGVQTHPGKKRSENQDRVSRAPTPFGDVYIVADGVGGQGGGGAAAQAVVGGFTDYLKAHGAKPLADALQNAAREISAELLRRSQRNGQSQSMSSTVVLAVINGDRATIAHAGDSRAYLARDNRLRLLTRDDSLVERLISQGILTPAQAREHPDSSVLTQAIGQRSEVTMTISEFTLQPGDALLLCSDGLWGYAEHSEIEAVALSSHIGVSGVADALLNLALLGGGGDNISIQYIRFTPPWVGTRTPSKWWGAGGRVAIPAVIAAACLLASAAAMTWQNILTPKTVARPGLTLDDGSLPVPPAIPAVSPPGRTKVIVVTVPEAPLPAWAGRLESVATLDVQTVQDSSGCEKLRQPKAVLINVPFAADAANDIREKFGLDPSAGVELSPEQTRACGNAGLFVLPAKP